ncbi:Acyl-CoA N-acyltransferases (NAT) superfamily protein [Rhynchospora pubera]|uniref:Acyl-CoA N-acyltransferases (NAT) superfamily protein n=1 Tax=Rhynchospora pubera TaxID=906938 RepID=A0AAV8BP64_9POAL|nr:Acyl-CoA N-acyltransferases (NAT) superfamily protein [Rhynchospora pubera]
MDGQTPEINQNCQPLTVALREFELTDVDDYFVWASDDRVSAWSRRNTFTNKEDILTFMKETVLPHPWMRAICLDGRPVGAIWVTHCKDERQCCAELGYVLAWQYWGRGITTKAVKLVLGTIFGDMEGVERLEALVLVQNVGSQKVLEKAGFTKEGILKKYLIHKGKISDIVMYSFIPTAN